MRIIGLFILVFLLSSCGCWTDKKKFNFDNNEPRHISCYNTGDTICFENSESEIDTFTVIAVDSAKGKECKGFGAPRPIGKSCWVTIKHLPVDKWHGISIEYPNDTTIEYDELINITKDPIENKSFFTFEYKDFYAGWNYVLGKPNTDTLTINNKPITNYYKINPTYPERLTEPTSVVTLIWTDKDGLTAYKNKNGDWWTKKQRTENKKSCP
jgi:hypothetical protein